jgi:hypothetical protein
MTWTPKDGPSVKEIDLWPDINYRHPRLCAAARAAHDLYAEVERLRAELELAQHRHEEASELLESRTAALAGARKDTERLDWLNSRMMGCQTEIWRDVFGSDVGLDAPSLRAAIDRTLHA